MYENYANNSKCQQIATTGKPTSASVGDIYGWRWRWREKIRSHKLSGFLFFHLFRQHRRRRGPFLFARSWWVCVRLWRLLLSSEVYYIIWLVDDVFRVLLSSVRPAKFLCTFNEKQPQHRRSARATNIKFEMVRRRTTEKWWPSSPCAVAAVASPFHSHHLCCAVMNRCFRHCRHTHSRHPHAHGCLLSVSYVPQAGSRNPTCHRHWYQMQKRHNRTEYWRVEEHKWTKRNKKRIMRGNGKRMAH